MARARSTEPRSRRLLGAQSRSAKPERKARSPRLSSAGSRARIVRSAGQELGEPDIMLLCALEFTLHKQIQRESSPNPPMPAMTTTNAPPPDISTAGHQGLRRFPLRQRQFAASPQPARATPPAAKTLVVLRDIAPRSDDTGSSSRRVPPQQRHPFRPPRGL